MGAKTGPRGVHQIVTAWLRDHGYTGLKNDAWGCACTVDMICNSKVCGDGYLCEPVTITEAEAEEYRRAGTVLRREWQDGTGRAEK